MRQKKKVFFHEGSHILEQDAYMPTATGNSIVEGYSEIGPPVVLQSCDTALVFRAVIPVTCAGKPVVSPVPLHPLH